MRYENGFTIGRVDEIIGTGGWFAGAFMEERGFEGLQLDNIECAVKDLPETDPSLPHFHTKSTEITYVISGRLTLILGSIEKFEQISVGEGEFFIIRPGTVLQNPRNEKGTKVFVVKTPSIPDDKFYTR